ncbi:hypothetical protein RCI35_004549 [Enterobacter hormaechei]|nr:hypothetical protein [Enterobacter hormaechei]
MTPSTVIAGGWLSATLVFVDFVHGNRPLALTSSGMDSIQLLLCGVAGEVVPGHSLNDECRRVLLTSGHGPGQLVVPFTGSTTDCLTATKNALFRAFFTVQSLSG